MAASPYKTEHANQIRWALVFAKQDFRGPLEQSLRSEAMVKLRDFVISSDCKRCAGAPPSPDFGINVIDGVAEAVNRQMGVSAALLHWYDMFDANEMTLEDARVDLQNLLSRLGNGKENRLSAHFGGCLYEISAESGQSKFQLSREVVSWNPFPGAPWRQRIAVALVFHLAHSGLTPTDIFTCSRCKTGYLPKWRKPRGPSYYCGPECSNYAHERNRSPRQTREWEAYAKFLFKAERSAEGVSHIDQFIKKHVPGGRPAAMRDAARIRKAPRAAKAIWDRLPEKTRSAFRDYRERGLLW